MSTLEQLIESMDQKVSEVAGILGVDVTDQPDIVPEVETKGPDEQACYGRVVGMGETVLRIVPADLCRRKT
ncbi:MAG: hypothetical protein KGJ82_11220 [Nitrospirota bacterium]|nr:hypothetical protein [Nitrospirota bacterium]